MNSSIYDITMIPPTKKSEVKQNSIQFKIIPQEHYSKPLELVS